MKRPFAVLAAVSACAMSPILGCRDEPRWPPPAAALAPVVEPGPPVLARAAFLATIGGPMAAPSAPPPRPASAHAPPPEAPPDEVEYRFAERGGGVAWVATGSGTSRVFHDGKPGPGYEGVGGVALSLDGSRVAYVALRAGKHRVVVDGKEGAPFDEADEPVFSPDGRHLAYGARLGESWYVVVDGTRSAAGSGRIAQLGFSADGGRIAFLELTGADSWGRLVVADPKLETRTVVAERAVNLIFNASRTRVAAIGQDGSRRRTVSVAFDDLGHVALGPPQDELSNLAFGDDGVCLGYLATRAGRSYAHLDDLEVQVGRSDSPVVGPVIPRDRSVLGLAVVTGGAVVLREFASGRVTTSKRYEGIDDLVYAREGGGHAFVAHRGETSFVVVDGVEGPAFDRVVGPAFSPDGRHVVYRARKDGKRFVVVADRPGNAVRQQPPYEQVFPFRFTPDGAVAYGVKDGRTLAWKVEPL